MDRTNELNVCGIFVPHKIGLNDKEKDKMLSLFKKFMCDIIQYSSEELPFDPESLDECRHFVKCTMALWNNKCYFDKLPPNPSDVEEMYGMEKAKETANNYIKFCEEVLRIGEPLVKERNNKDIKCDFSFQ